MLNEQLFKIKGNDLKNSCSIWGYSTNGGAGKPPIVERRHGHRQEPCAPLPLQRQKQEAIPSQNAAKQLAYIWAHRLRLPLISYCLFALVSLFSIYFFVGCKTKS